MKPEETFYEITLKAVPKFLFCWSATLHGYRNEFRNRQNYLELCFTEKGHARCEEIGETFVVEPHSLIVLTSLADCRFHGVDDEVQRHVTVGVTAEYDVREIDEEEARRNSATAAENVLILPRIKRFARKSFDSFALRIQRMGAKRYSGLVADKPSALSEWFSLCAEVTKATFSGETVAPSSELYVDKIMKYIASSPSRMTIGELAAALGISDGYMQTTFKNATGKTIVEYANEYRIKTAAETLKTHRMKLKDLAENLGIDDPAYLSRLFKKVMGVSFVSYVRSLELTEVDGIPPEND